MGGHSCSSPSQFRPEVHLQSNRGAPAMHILQPLQDSFAPAAQLHIGIPVILLSSPAKLLMADMPDPHQNL